MLGSERSMEIGGGRARRTAVSTLVVVASVAVLFLVAGVVGVPWASAGSASAEDEQGAGKSLPHILFFTKSSGYEHGVVKRKNGELSHSEKVVVELGKKHGFLVTATKDGRVFDGDLTKYDAFLFYTSGNLLVSGNDGQPPISAAGKKKLLAVVRGGKGLLGVHSASDSFHSPGDRFANQKQPDEYICCLGGEFVRHGPQQKARMRVADPRFPGLQGLGEGFDLHEEWYSLKNFAPDLHVLLVQETAGMKGSDYQRPPFPSTWVRREGKGRVFYSAMGHRADVWTNPIFQNVLLGGISWTVGKVEAETAPNMAKATPQAAKMPPRPPQR